MRVGLCLRLIVECFPSLQELENMFMQRHYGNGNKMEMWTTLLATRPYSASDLLNFASGRIKFKILDSFSSLNMEKWRINSTIIL